MSMIANSAPVASATGASNDTQLGIKPSPTHATARTIVPGPRFNLKHCESHTGCSQCQKRSHPATTRGSSNNSVALLII